MKKTLLYAIACIILALLPAACAPANLFQAPPPEPEIILSNDEALDYLPDYFEFTPRTENTYTFDSFSFDDNCRESAPLKAGFGHAEFGGYIFKSELISKNIIDTNNAASVFRMNLVAIKIEEYTVNLLDNTVYFDDPNTGTSLVLNPQDWIDAANTISNSTPPTYVKVEYIRYTGFNPAESFDTFIEKAEENGITPTRLEEIYWLGSTVTCTTTNP